MPGQSLMNTGVTVAIIIVAVIFAAVCILWIFRKTRYVCNRRSMFRRSNSIRLPNQVDSAALTLRDTCRNCPASLTMKRPDTTTCPSWPSCADSVKTHQTASLADVPSTEMLQSRAHRFPQHRIMYNDRFTAVDNGSDDPRNIMLQSPEASFESIKVRMLQQTVLPEAVPQTTEFQTSPLAPLENRVTPGLKTCRLQVNTDVPIECYNGNLAKRIILEFEGSDSGNSDSMDALPASLVHSSDAHLPSLTVCKFAAPKLSSTSILSMDGQIVKTGVTSTMAQVATPPPTPTSGPIFTTSPPQFNLHPVVRDRQDKEPTEDITTWSDVLSFAEYEREEHLIHARRKVFSFQNHLPSPPPTPTLFFTPHSPPSLTPSVAIQEAQCLNTRSTSYLFLEHTGKHNNDDLRSTAHQHYYSFVHEHETARTPPNYCGLPIDVDAEDENNTNSNDGLPPYQAFGFDYETRLAFKRATSLLAKPARPEVSTTRMALKQVAPAVRPRPPLAEYKPLLLRPIDRSKIKTRTGFLGVEVLPLAVAKQSMIPTTPIQRKGSGARGELSPHI